MSNPIVERVLKEGLTYAANVRVRDLPRAVDESLTALAAHRGIPKWEIVQAALIEFAANHKDEING